MFVLALIPLSLILRKAKAAYEFLESKEKINHLLFIDDLELYSRSEKGLDSLVQRIGLISLQNFEILGWCPAGPVLRHGEKVPL